MERGNLLSLPEIASLLGVNPSTVRLWVSEGRLPATKISRRWLVDRSDLERMLEQQPRIGHPRAGVGARNSDDPAPSPRARLARVGGRASSDWAGRGEPLVSREVAIDRLHRSDERWQAAARGFEPFAVRLRALADAASDHSRALTLADLANVRWNPQPGARQLRLAYELQAVSGRPGPPALWKAFDDAINDLGFALEGTDVKALAVAFGNLAEILDELADACQAADADRRAS